MTSTKMLLESNTIIQLDAGEQSVVILDGEVYVLWLKLPTPSVGKPLTEETTESVPKTEKPQQVTGASETAEVVNDKKPRKGRPAKDAAVESPAPPIENVAEESQVVEETEEPEQVTAATPALVEYEEIPAREFVSLEPGTIVYARLDIPGEDGEKYWEAKVQGVSNGLLNVFFIEDATQMELVPPEDRLFFKK